MVKGCFMDDADMQRLLSGVTGDGTLNALREFDQRGRKKFLDTTKFGPSNSYFIEQDSRLYDVRAIAAYAYSLSNTPSPARRDFGAGDDARVARHLQTLGFTVWNLRRPDWTRDEIILACDLVRANGWRL
jgi:hypothetical protein